MPTRTDMPSLVSLIDHIKGPELGVQGATPAEVIGAAEQFLGLQPAAGASLHARALAVCSTAGIHLDDAATSQRGPLTVEALDVMLQTEREDAPGKTVSWQGEVDARVKSRAGQLEETAGELEVPAATKPSTTVPPELSRRSSSEPTLLGRHNQHYRTRILEELGPPSSTMWLNLDRINRTLCGLPDKRKSVGLSEVAAYSAFMDPSVRGGSHVVASRNVLFGEDAAMMRRALLMTHLIMRHELLPAADVRLLSNLQHVRERRGRFRSALLKARPLFFGTASGLNSFVRRRLSHAPVACRVALFILNDLLRS